MRLILKKKEIVCWAGKMAIAIYRERWALQICLLDL